VFALCAPSYGHYILVYKGTIALNAFDWDDYDLHTETVNCYVVLNIDNDDDEDGAADDSAIVIYGKDEEGYKVYRTQWYSVDLEWTDYFEDADYAILYFYVDGSDDDDGGYVVGKVKNANVGAGNEPVISNPSGTIQFYDDGADFLDHSQDLEGSGRVSLTLDSRGTKQVNRAETSFDDVVYDIEDDLEHQGYYDYWD
jgi:hypothetical protein